MLFRSFFRKHHLLDEHGTSLEWTAVFMAFVLLPLLALAIDGARLFYIQSHLQTAADAACQAALDVAIDRETLRDSGMLQIVLTPQVTAAGREVFYATLEDSLRQQFNPAVLIRDAENAPTALECRAAAAVNLFILPGNLIVRGVAVSDARSRWTP